LIAAASVISSVMKVAREAFMPRILVVDDDPMVCTALEVCLVRFLRMALDLGATRGLRKPFTPVTLMTVINERLADNQARHGGLMWRL
jgi:hypothetical protein